MMALLVPALITLSQTSGYTRPENAFQMNCVLNAQFEVVSQISKGRTDSGWEMESTQTIAPQADEIKRVQTWLAEAAQGPFETRMNPCDIGSLIVTTPEYPLLVSKDCNKRVTNLNPSAVLLTAWMQKTCSLMETKNP